MPAKPLVLKKGEDRRLRAGHLWVYSNEVDTHATPLHALTPGDSVTVFTSGGKAMGTGYVNPHSLICARLLDRDRPWSTALCSERLKRALALRERLFDGDPTIASCTRTATVSLGSWSIATVISWWRNSTRPGWKGA